MRRVLVVSLCLLVGVVSCGGGKTRSGSSAPKASPRAGETPKDSGTPDPLDEITPTVGGPYIDMNYPGRGAVVKGSSVKVSVIVANFQVAPNWGQPPRDGEGHIIYYIDVDPPRKPGETAIPADETAYRVSADTTVTFDGVEPGEHRISAQLVNNDNTALDPPSLSSFKISTIAG